MYYVVNSNEYERLISIYKYIKIVGIKVIVPPRNIQTNTAILPGRISYDWLNDQAENLLSDDNAKIINPYNTRTRVYKFKPPNMNIRYGERYYNYGEWLPITFGDSVIPPGFIKISSAFPIALTVETIVRFRGNETQLEARGPGNLLTIDNKTIKIKERNKDDISNKDKIIIKNDIIESNDEEIEDSGDEDFLKEEKVEDKKVPTIKSNIEPESSGII